jgi:hypothetical protein
MDFSVLIWFLQNDDEEEKSNERSGDRNLEPAEPWSKELQGGYISPEPQGE